MLSAGTLYPVLLLCCLSLAVPAVAGWGQQEYPLPASELDRAFELEVYHRLIRGLGLETTRYVRITRFGNTILITGMVPGEEAREEVEKVVLEVAGIRREAPDTAEVVPVRTRDCGGKPVLGNVRRKQIVSGDRECSALRAAPEVQATGQLFNHVELTGQEPDRYAAVADVLAAQARLALVEAGIPQALDRDAMRIAAQGGVLYVLLPAGAAQSGIEEVLLRVPGVMSVRFYTG